jgi:hypothetical protein
MDLYIVEEQVLLSSARNFGNKMKVKKADVTFTPRRPSLPCSLQFKCSNGLSLNQKSFDQYLYIRKENTLSYRSKKESTATCSC